MLSQIVLKPDQANQFKSYQTSYYYHDIHPHFEAYTQGHCLKEQRVLIPLYSNDRALKWYRDRAAHVIGIELVSNVGKEFLQKQNLTYNTVDNDRYEADKITIFSRNIFEIDKNDIGIVDLIYDRAALVELPENLHHSYRRKIKEFMDAESTYLLII